MHALMSSVIDQRTGGEAVMECPRTRWCTQGERPSDEEAGAQRGGLSVGDTQSGCQTTRINPGTSKDMPAHGHDHVVGVDNTLTVNWNT